MKTRRLGKGGSGAGGVALADILANSVAVLLILIFLSISVKQEQAERQIEQTVDISVLMARQLADSVVLNDLPNSRPAYLHDYHSCSIVHDCQPYLYPVIEIYDQHARILNTNQVLNRHALLQPTNVLDEYLASLDSNQMNNIRVDIYGIGMFYLTVATLREYKAPLSHWHFLGEKATGSTNSGGDTVDGRLAELLQQGEEGLADEGSLGHQNGQQLPSGVDIANPGQIAGLEEENLLLPPEELGSDSNAQNQPAQQGQGQEQGDLLEQLLGEFSRSRGDNEQQLARSGQRKFQLRLPNFTPPQTNESVELNLDPEQINLLLLTFLFRAMEDARSNNRFDPKRLGQIFSQLIQHPESYRGYQHFSLIRDIDTILASLLGNPDRTISVDFQQQETNEPVQLSLTPNSSIRKILLSGKQLLAGQQELIDSGAHSVDILMRLYPFIYRGDRATVSSDMVMLMHPDDFRFRGNRWHPIALVSRDLQDMTLGFVYGQFSAGALHVPVDVNQVRTQSVILQSDFGDPFPRFSWQLALAFLFVGLILLFIFGTIVKSYRHGHQ